MSSTIACWTHYVLATLNKSAPSDRASWSREPPRSATGWWSPARRSTWTWRWSTTCRPTAAPPAQAAAWPSLGGGSPLPVVCTGLEAAHSPARLHWWRGAATFHTDGPAADGQSAVGGGVQGAVDCRGRCQAPVSRDPAPVGAPAQCAGTCAFWPGSVG